MRRMRRLILPVLILGAIFLLGLLLTDPSKAQDGPTWLPFDGSSTAAEPELALIDSGPAGIQLNATLPGAYTEAVSVDGITYTRLSAAGYGYPEDVGLPEVPVLRREVEIPFGAQVSVEIISAQFIETSIYKLGLNPIYPMQPPTPKLEGVEDNQPFIMDQAYYRQGSLYPSNVVTMSAPYVVRGHRILPVEVWPVAYRPSEDALRLYSQVTFRLVLTGADMAATRSLAERYASPAFDPTLSKRVLNYNQGHPVEVAEQVGYLIFSADAYKDTLLPFIDLRKSQGFQVTTVLASAVPGGPTAENIKAYIQVAYETWAVPPSYVLLVGDTDTIPTWTGPTIQTSTDLYYATMDGEEDWHPDLGRGRFPVRSVQQATAMVDKYLAYAGLTGQEPWLKTASFVASCDPTYFFVAEGTHNHVITNHTGPGGWTGTFPQDPNLGGDQLYCISFDATRQDLTEQFSQGRWGIIYSGHGSYEGWEMGFIPQDIRDLPPNNVYPFVASHACLTGDFGQPEVFGETWVLQPNRGALVFWGSSTFSYWEEDDYLERMMFDALFAEDSPHADVTTMTYEGLAELEIGHPQDARYYWETYNLLGDPSVHLFMDPVQPFFTLDVAPTRGEVCTSGTLTSTVEIGSVLGYSDTVYLEHGALPFNVEASFGVDQAPAPYTTTLNLEVMAGAPNGEHIITLTATDQASQTLVSLYSLGIHTTLPETPTLLGPPDGSANQPVLPIFTWEATYPMGLYNFRLDTSPLFPDPLVAEGLADVMYSPPAPLEGGVCYWWSAQGVNACGAGGWAEPFHFSTEDMGVAFADDLESGTVKWTHQAVVGADHWLLTTQQSHSPTHAWFVPDDETITDSRLWTTQAIPVGEGSTLTFWHRFQFEGPGYDGGVIEISTDHGDTWTDLGPYITSNGYNGTLSTEFDNPLGGREAWTGDIIMWEQVSVDLSSFAGRQVMIRWRVGCDITYGDDGWVIDDVQVTAPQPPHPAPTLLSISPASGSNAVPTPVVISGSAFIDTAAIKLGDTWLETFSVLSSTTIEAEIPAGLPAGTYDLALFNGDCQEAALADAFEVLEPRVFHYVFMPVTFK